MQYDIVTVCLGIKQRIVDMLLSYNPLWLRIGLETIYGEILNLHSNADVISLSRFILTRLLGNPDIAHEYAHQSVRHLYKPGTLLCFSRDWQHLLTRSDTQNVSDHIFMC